MFLPHFYGTQRQGAELSAMFTGSECLTGQDFTRICCLISNGLIKNFRLFLVENIVSTIFIFSQKFLNICQVELMNTILYSTVLFYFMSIIFIQFILC